MNWSYETRIDLQTACNYIGDYNPTGAKKTVEKIYEKIRRLKDHLSIGRPEKINGTRKLIIAPYIAIYRLENNAVEILRLYHGAQNWPENGQ